MPGGEGSSLRHVGGHNRSMLTKKEKQKSFTLRVVNATSCVGGRGRLNQCLPCQHLTRRACDFVLAAIT